MISERASILGVHIPPIIAAPTGVIITRGLVAAWNFTGQIAGVQQINGSDGTTYNLMNGTTSGVDGDDCAPQTQGMFINTAGADDYMHVPMADSLLTGPVTLCIVCNPVNTVGQHFFGKNNAQNVNIPIKFYELTGGVLRTERANASGMRVWSGPSISSGLFRMYSVVAPTGMENAPSFYIGNIKTIGSSVSGSVTGNPTGTNQELRIGLAQDASMAASYVVTYALVYNVELTDLEITSNYTFMCNTFNAPPFSLNLPNPV